MIHLAFQVHHPTDSIGDFIEAVLTALWIIFALVFVPLYLLKRKLKLKGRWYSPINFIRQLLGPYQGNFGPVVFFGRHAVVQYQIVGLFGSVLDAWMTHKGEERKINAQLQILLAGPLWMNLYAHAKALHIEIITLQPIDGSTMPEPPAASAPPREEPGIVIGE